MCRACYGGSDSSDEDDEYDYYEYRSNSHRYPSLKPQNYLTNEELQKALTDATSPPSSTFHRVTHATFKTEAEIKKSYLEKYRVDATWNEAKLALLQAKPENPYEFLSNYMKIKGEELELTRQQERMLFDQQQLKFQPTIEKMSDLATALTETLDTNIIHLTKQGDFSDLINPEKLDAVKESLLKGVTWRTLAELKHSKVFDNLEQFKEAFTEKNFDTAIKREEDKYRKLFAQDRGNPILNDIHLSCVDVFENTHLFVHEQRSDRIPLAMDFTTTKDFIPNTTTTVVNNMDMFMNKLDSFTDDQLPSADEKSFWDNMIIAGGSIMACLKPLPKEYQPETQENINSYFEDFFKESDIDIFLYGLTPEQANEKLLKIYSCLCSNNPLIVRTNNAVTFCCDYPNRHVQVILRLYKSPSEILMGFDLDCCAVGFDGHKVWALPRAIRSLNRQYNLIDMSRRSYTYETRLLKYAQRGFAVGVPGLKRENINPAIYSKKFNELGGLARLLLLESKFLKEKVFNPTSIKSLKRDYSYKPDLLDDTKDLAQALRGDDFQKQRIEKFEQDAQLRCEEYNAVFLPWGPGWKGEDIEEQLIFKYLRLNGTTRMTPFRICPCFFFWKIEQLFTDSWHVAVPNNRVARSALEKYQRVNNNNRDLYVVGDLQWLQVDPGRQMIGSFHPHTINDWERDVYITSVFPRQPPTNQPSHPSSIPQPNTQIPSMLGSIALPQKRKQDVIDLT